MLVENGYIEEVMQNTNNDKQFVNIFDEIEHLLIQYNTDLNLLLNSDDDTPQCLKVETETVLRNMIKFLQHLTSLKQ